MSPPDREVDPSKPYFAMTVQEYASTAHSQIVPRWSVLALAPETYTAPQLCRQPRKSLAALAFFWDVKKDGSKEELAARIIARVQLRLMLANENEQSLASRSREGLRRIAEQANVYHPWLNRKQLAASLAGWVQDQRQRARFEVAKTKHESIVQKAASKGLPVPAEVLSYYGLYANGEREPTICGTPLSQAMRMAGEVINAASNESLPEFREWLETHPQESARLAFFPGILGDGGNLFWKLIQKALSPPELPPLFAQLKDADARDPGGRNP